MYMYVHILVFLDISVKYVMFWQSNCKLKDKSAQRCRRV